VTHDDIEAYLQEARELTIAELRDIVPRSERLAPVLYDLMLDYPLRSAKALRPSLCIATSRALGGRLECVLRSAAALELYHNAFLIHDDVEDGSELRRDRPTLHRLHGVPVAVNVGDAMLALSLEPLLENMRLLGMGKALRILEIVARMARETAEGQAIELDWIRAARFDLADADYVRMVHKKTSWYTFVAPMLIGAVAAGADARLLVALRKFASLLGIAFQIQDDVLNLTADRALYGKEIEGDLWEGKHTLMVLHMMRTVGDADRERARGILARARPVGDEAERAGDLAGALERVRERVAADADSAETVDRAIAFVRQRTGGDIKNHHDIAFLRAQIDAAGSIEHATRVARGFAERARDAWAPIRLAAAASVHRDLIEGLIDYVSTRDR
jgi:geranylgeranyl diphosphate synthase type II